MCQKNVAFGMHVLTKHQRNFILFKRGVFVPSGAQCCHDHLYNKYLSYDSIQQISVFQRDKLALNAEDVQNILIDIRSILTNMKTFDFDDCTSILHESYINFTELKKDIDLSNIESLN